MKNTGSGNLTLNNAIALPAGFSLVSSFGSTNLTSDSETTFSVKFDATAIGTYSGQISFANSDSDEDPFNFQISGTRQPFDTTPPTATLNPIANISAGSNSLTFTVEYGDNTAVDVSSLDSSDIRVSGPNNFSQLVAFLSANSGGNGTPRTATYQINAPGDSWDAADNGTYSHFK